MTGTPEADAWRRRETSTPCTTCQAVPGQPCRHIYQPDAGGVSTVGARLHRPHRERLLAAIFGGRP